MCFFNWWFLFLVSFKSHSGCTAVWPFLRVYRYMFFLSTDKTISEHQLSLGLNTVAVHELISEQDVVQLVISTGTNSVQAMNPDEPTHRTITSTPTSKRSDNVGSQSTNVAGANLTDVIVSTLRLPTVSLSLEEITLGKQMLRQAPARDRSLGLTASCVVAQWKLCRGTVVQGSFRLLKAHHGSSVAPVDVSQRK